jgi:DNA invertase Pin-like site-specific DNA recombinase
VPSSSDSPVSGRAAGLVRGAQYVRMSTEHQKYSTENQADAIAQYAAANGITIVRTYADHGKSGLSLEGRRALGQLIHDVQSRNTDFDAVLVYDVSRWGRFQDADESAYYEYLCKAAGLTVHYCAEQFQNDGSLSATIIKSMKRAMAGEYSRELSAKVFAGQCRLIRLGFRQGGAPGYGLRRLLVDDARTPKCLLEVGERKSLQTDRVVLVPGPTHEVDTVRRIYHWCVKDALSPHAIAAALNREGLPAHTGGAWSPGLVRGVLRNEKYAGHNVYNHTSFKLKTRRVVNPPELWVRAENAFEPLVDPEMFAEAQRTFEARERLSDAETLQGLRTLREQHGYLSGVMIDQCPTLPSSAAIGARFGGLLQAYALIGYSPNRDYDFVTVNRELRQQHRRVVATAVGALEALGSSVRWSNAAGLLRVNDEFDASILIARCETTSTGALRWRIRFDRKQRPDIAVALRMNTENRDVLDYFVFPTIEVATAGLRLRPENGLAIDAYRFDTLEGFLHLAARASIRSAA